MLAAGRQMFLKIKASVKAVHQEQCVRNECDFMGDLVVKLIQART